MGKYNVLVLNDSEKECSFIPMLEAEYQVRECMINEVDSILNSNFTTNLIILNVNSRSTDETAFLVRVLGKEGLKELPIILIAENESYEAEAMALQIGAMDYLRKPVKAQVLLSRMKKAISIYQNKEMLISNANKDVLTGLWNRNYLEEHIRYLHRKENKKGIFLLLDMDNFKEVNDQLGHATGDKLLIQLASALLSESKKGDIACRIGGDEFVLFIEEDLDASKVRVRAERILDSVEEAIEEVIHSRLEDVSVSIGITAYPEDGNDFKTLYANADKALYFVKQNGKRGFHFYHDNYTYSIKFHPENNAIDIEQLKEYIKETSISNGAYTVRYDGFKRIYQFVSRTIERTGQKVQILIFTLETKDWDTISNDEMQLAIENMGSGIHNLLRKGDVASKYSNSQYIVILMDTNKDNGCKVAERVRNSWENQNLNPELHLSYVIGTIEREEKY